MPRLLTKKTKTDIVPKHTEIVPKLPKIRSTAILRVHPRTVLKHSSAHALLVCCILREEGDGDSRGLGLGPPPGARGIFPSGWAARHARSLAMLRANVPRTGSAKKPAFSSMPRCCAGDKTSSPRRTFTNQAPTRRPLSPGGHLRGCPADAQGSVGLAFQSKASAIHESACMCQPPAPRHSIAIAWMGARAFDLNYCQGTRSVNLSEIRNFLHFTKFQGPPLNNSIHQQQKYPEISRKARAGKPWLVIP